MGSRERRNKSRGRAEGRVRGRVQQRARGGARQGGAKRTGGPERKRNTLDLGAIEGYANRLADRSGGASGLAGAASGLAGGSFASRLMAGDTSMPEEEFRKKIAEHFALLEERLRRLEEQVPGSAERHEVERELPESGSETDPGANP